MTATDGWMPPFFPQTFQLNECIYIQEVMSTCKIVKPKTKATPITNGGKYQRTVSSHRHCHRRSATLVRWVIVVSLRPYPLIALQIASEGAKWWDKNSVSVHAVSFARTVQRLVV